MENNNLHKVVNRREIINSIGLAILLCANPLSWLLPIDNIIVAISLMSLLIVIINNPITTFINKKLFVVVGVTLLFLFSYLFAKIDLTIFSLYFFSFFVFGVTGLLYSSTPFDYKVFYKSILIISIVSLPGIYRISNTDYSQMGDVSGFLMGISRGALRLLLGVFIAVFLFKNKLLKVGLFLIILIYLSFFFSFGTRSSIVGLLLFFVFYYLIRKEKLTYRSVILMFLLAFVFSFFVIDIVTSIHNLLQQIGINVKAIEKIIRMFEMNQELSNGRTRLWIQAFKDISVSPFFGNGISAYEKINGIYPHNFLIQIFHEGGILYIILILIVILKFFGLLISNKQSGETKIFLIYLFFSGIVELLFSNVYWRNVYFWFFIGYVLSLSLTTNSKKRPINATYKRYFINIKI